MNSFKMICLDIDGTLLNSKHQITDRVKETINIVSNKMKIPVILVSARMPKGIKFLQDELGIEEPIICYSGSLILDENNNILDREAIDIEDIEKIYGIVKSRGGHISLYLDDEWYVEEMDCWAKQESDITNIVPMVSNFNELLKSWREEKKSPNKVLLMAAPDEINFFKNNTLDLDLNIYPSKETYLEIMSRNASKTSAINFLQSKFKLNESEIITIGDNYNDIDMLKYAGLGIAMGNAPDEVKKSANDITLTNDEDGVAEALKKYVILKED